MEGAIEEFPEYSDKTTDGNIDNYEASINNYEVSKILELDVPLERVKENMKHIEHIEHIVESYIDFLENKEINEYLNKNTEWFSPEEINEFKETFNKLVRYIYMIY